MDPHRFDDLTRALSATASRRSVLKGVAAAIVAAAAVGRSRTDIDAADCADNSGCSGGMVCDGGFCVFPPCLGEGSGCSSNEDCCDDRLCTGGVCTPTTYCVFEPGGSCNGSNLCCPGLVCSGGACAAETTSGGGAGGSGGSGGSEGNGGGGGEELPADGGGGGGVSEPVYGEPAAPASENAPIPLPSEPSASSAPNQGKTSTGASVARLPSTGVGETARISGQHGLVLGALAVAAGVSRLVRFRRPSAGQ